MELAEVFRGKLPLFGGFRELGWKENLMKEEGQDDC